ncbi:terpene synthase family protein [Mycobacterium sp. LTG2003]
MDTQLDIMTSFGISMADISDACNERVEDAHILTRQWANDHGLLGVPHQQRKFDQLGYTHLLAYGCTTAAMDRLALFAQWFTYYFLLDDQQDLAVLTGRTHEFGELQDDLRRILHTHGEDAAAHRSGLRAAVAELCRRTRPLVSSDWWDRYVHHAEQVFAAQRRENVYRLSGIVPAPEEFKRVRRDAGAADMVFDIIEACEGLEIPAPIRASAACSRYADDLNDFTTWSNDVMGVDHDAGNADPNNFVLVRQHVDNLTRDEAIRAVTAEIADLVGGLAARMDDVRAAGRALPAEQQARAAKALNAWHDWAMNVPVHYLKANGRLSQMDRAKPRQPAGFTEDLL